MTIRMGKGGMQSRMPKCYGYNHCAGVSEVIGSVLLIALVVAGVAIVGIFLFSQQTPTEIPNLNFMVGQDTSGTKLYLFHNGGDSLKNGEFSVLFDGVPQPYLIVGGTDNWSLGKNLCLTISSPPKQIQVVYGPGGNGATVLSSASVNVSTTPGFTPADISSTAPLPDSCGLCDLNTIPDRVAAQYMANLSRDYIYFGRDTRSDIPVGGFFNFTVKSPGWIQAQGTTPLPFPLAVNDQVAINQRANTAYKIFIVGNEIMELRAVTVDVRVKYASNGTTRQIVNNGNVYNAWVPACTVDSTLDIVTTAGASNMLLVMNDSIIINSATNTSAVTINNPRPTKAGLFSLIHDAGTNVYFIGDADAVTLA